jgi:hypothetical protein
MNHKSNSEDVLWYIDSVTKTINGLYKIVGWITHKTEIIDRIVVGEICPSRIVIDRPDVQEVYPSIPTKSVGFSFIIGEEYMAKPINVHLQNSVIENIGTLESYYIATLGFNKLEKDLVVVDNFYNKPDILREYAIKNLTFAPSGYHKGQRSDCFMLDGTKEAFERILGREIYNWNHPNYANGVFQFCTKEDPIVYHVDTQTYAGLVFLSPNAPLTSGTATYKSKVTGATRFTNEEMGSDLFNKTFIGYGDAINFYDGSSFELVDRVANVYNRLVLFDSKTIHAATEYYGSNINDSRFFHLFFFDVK